MMEDKYEKKSIEQRWRSFKKGSIYKILSNKFSVVTIAFLFIVLFFSDHSLINWGVNSIDVSRQERLIWQYNWDIKTVEDKLKELTSDRDSLEKFAREQYYFQERNEDVFIVIE